MSSAKIGRRAPEEEEEDSSTTSTTSTTGSATLPANAADAATDMAAASAIFFILILQSFVHRLRGKVVTPHDASPRLYLVTRFKQLRIGNATGRWLFLGSQKANVVK